MKAAYDLSSHKAEKFVRIEAKCLIYENPIFDIEEFSPAQYAILQKM